MSPDQLSERERERERRGNTKPASIDTLLKRLEPIVKPVQNPFTSPEPYVFYEKWLYAFKESLEVIEGSIRTATSVEEGRNFVRRVYDYVRESLEPLLLNDKEMQDVTKEVENNMGSFREEGAKAQARPHIMSGVKCRALIEKGYYDKVQEIYATLSILDLWVRWLPVECSDHYRLLVSALRDEKPDAYPLDAAFEKDSMVIARKLLQHTPNWGSPLDVRETEMKKVEKEVLYRMRFAAMNSYLDTAYAKAKELIGEQILGKDLSKLKELKRLRV